jgi:hypothetical protein
MKGKLHAGQYIRVPFFSPLFFCVSVLRKKAFLLHRYTNTHYKMTISYLCINFLFVAQINLPPGTSIRPFLGPVRIRHQKIAKMLLSVANLDPTWNSTPSRVINNTICPCRCTFATAAAAATTTIILATAAATFWLIVVVPPLPLFLPPLPALPLPLLSVDAITTVAATETTAPVPSAAASAAAPLFLPLSPLSLYFHCPPPT